MIKSLSHVVFLENKFNWIELWSKRIDYIEYRLSSIEYQSKYKNINDSVYYYIGMGENALQYVTNTLYLEKDEVNNFVISHRRIYKNNFNNPLNIIIDYRSRDVSEYLKYIFFNNKYDYLKIEELLNKIKFTKFELQLIYGRMLFPTFYFDEYDKIVLQDKDDSKLKEIIKRANEYEMYIKKIYTIICKIKKIPEISWL